MGNETKAVRVGGVWMGAGAPISVQSMTNTYTGDVEATTAQVRQLAEAGCEIVRMAVNDAPAAAAVREIRARTRVPLVADIHFDYRLAIAPSKTESIRYALTRAISAAKQMCVRLWTAQKRIMCPSASA